MMKSTRYDRIGCSVEVAFGRRRAEGFARVLRKVWGSRLRAQHCSGAFSLRGLPPTHTRLSRLDQATVRGPQNARAPRFKSAQLLIAPPASHVPSFRAFGRGRLRRLTTLLSRASTQLGSSTHGCV
eukprot:48169-Chlamydomonas_euryale.AAC.5